MVQWARLVCFGSTHDEVTRIRVVNRLLRVHCNTWEKSMVRTMILLYTK
jgi:hypothetical protein